MVDATHYTAVFTADDGFEGQGSVTVDAAKFTDAALNANEAATPDTVTIDTANPTVAIDIVDTALSDTDNSSLVTFTFSEAPVGFTLGDITPDQRHDEQTSSWSTATRPIRRRSRPTTASTGSGSATVERPTRSTDAAGNDGAGDTDDVDIDTENPTVTVTVASEPLTDASSSTTVTFQFSEAIDAASFVIGDIGYDPTKGTLSAFTQVDADTWTVTYTAIDGFDGSDTISVAAGSYTDAAGNSGGAGSDTVAIDRFEAPAPSQRHQVRYRMGTTSVLFCLTASRLVVLSVMTRPAMSFRADFLCRQADQLAPFSFTHRRCQRQLEQ